MKKLFKQELVDSISANEIEEVRKIVTESFEHIDLNTFQKAYYSGRFGFINICGIILSIIFAWLFFGVLDSAVAGLTSSISCILFILSTINHVISRKQRRLAISKKLNAQQENIYRQWFSKHYSDISIIGPAEADDFANCVSFNNEQLNERAKIKEIIPGYWVKCENGINIQAAKISWGSYNDKDGIKQSTKPRVYFMLSGTKDIFNGLSLQMCKKTILDKENATLENDDFNKTWFWKTNDDVKLRMLLTPSVQEEVLKTILDSSFVLSSVNDIFWVSLDLQENNSIFEINLRNNIPTLDKNEIIEDLVNDCLIDIALFQTCLSYIAVFRTLFEA